MKEAGGQAFTIACGALKTGAGFDSSSRSPFRNSISHVYLLLVSFTFAGMRLPLPRTHGWFADNMFSLVDFCCAVPT